MILGAVPTLWGLPQTLLENHPAVAPLGSALVFHAVAVAWNALLWGGTTIASIELAVGGKPTIGALVRGIRFWPAIFPALLVQLVPLQILVRTTDASPLLALALGIPAMLVVLLRGLAWVPLIVDRRLGWIQAFGASWKATRGSGLRICGLWTLLSALAIPAGLLAFGRPLAAHAAGLVTGPVFSVALAEVYLALFAGRADASGEPALSETMTPAPPAEELPTKGSGWTREANADSRRH